MIQIKRALISVSDKTGLVELAQTLASFGVEIISTGGTAKLLQSNGLTIRQIDDFTGFPEMLDGRVKTLHPKVHGGLLAIRGNAAHEAKVKEYNIQYIDLVCVNLYPFEATIAKPDVHLEEVIENIDIGGPSMIRSAAKNHASVAVLTSPDQYGKVMEELKANGGKLSPKTAKTLAVEAYARTAAYDTVISNYLRGKLVEDASAEELLFPATFTQTYNKVQDLRYGENPHQKAAFYKETQSDFPCVARAKQLQGKELSYNNIMDIDAAWKIILEFSEPAATIIKHTNPCGSAIGSTIAEAYKRAYEADSLSAFGGIIALNRRVDKATAEEIVKTFIECVIAPAYDADALEIMATKKNMRLLEVGESAGTKPAIQYDFKKVGGGLLVQELDTKMISSSDLQVVTRRKPSEAELKELLFAWKICKHVKSNAIVLSKNNQTVGVGAGQMSRILSTEIAIKKAEGNVKGSVMASDAFFFPDTVEAAAKAGITAVIQPGGSVRDKEVIEAADKLGMAIVFTGTRHFKH